MTCFATLGARTIGCAGDFGCYNPHNLQSRMMVCRASARLGHDGAHLVRAGEEALLRPSLTEAVKNMHEMDVVGSMDYFGESLCLMKAHAVPAAPTRLARCANEARNITRTITHRIPAHAAWSTARLEFVFVY